MAQLYKGRIVKAISVKKDDDGNEKGKSAKVTIRKDGEYKEIWPKITASTKNADLIVKDAKLDLYITEDGSFINAAYKSQEAPAANADDMDVNAGVDAGSDAAPL